MHMRVDPSFFLTKTMFDAQGLVEGSITPLLSISSIWLLTSSVICAGIRRSGCLTGRASQVFICLTTLVLPRSLFFVTNNPLYCLSNCSTSFIYESVRLCAVSLSNAFSSGEISWLADFGFPSSVSTRLTSFISAISVPAYIRCGSSDRFMTRKGTVSLMLTSARATNPRWESRNLADGSSTPRLVRC